jgi:transcriptional regulator with XRE-family HTH domain
MVNPVNEPGDSKRVDAAAKEFSQRLNKTRERQGLTQAQLAERSGLTPAAISQLESGDRKPTFPTIIRLAEALKTSPNDLMAIKDMEGLDPSLQPLFRDLKKLSKRDVENVKSFIAFLAREDEE